MIDCNEVSLHAGRDRATALGLGGRMRWLVSNVSELAVEDVGDVDLVIGLHACGGLTDAILDVVQRLQQQRTAEKAPVAFAICPCCFSKNVSLRPETSWAQNLSECEAETLARLAESPDRSVSWRAMTLVNSLRLSNAQKGIPDLQFRLTGFSEDLSLRNQVLLGVP